MAKGFVYLTAVVDVASRRVADRRVNSKGFNYRFRIDHSRRTSDPHQILLPINLNLGGPDLWWIF